MPTTIMVENETRDILRQMGYKGETYDQVIRNLIEKARRQMLYERQKKILESEEFVSIDKV